MEQIGKYKILAHIGHGAMGSVEKAEAPDGTIVAIKTLFPQFVFEEEYVKRFKREAELAKKLSHPNVVKILEVGEDNDGRCQYIVMEYIDGKTLAECMHDKGMASAAIQRSSKLNEKDETAPKGKKSNKKAPALKTFSAKETIKIIRQLAGVLQAANDISLLHRDIKPQNILLDKKGNAKLLDFGLAKDTEALVSMLSMTGQSIGTPPYMSPEQHDGQKDIDIRSDLYSLGCTAYHMLTGKAPFPGPTASAFARQHCDDIPTPVHAINKDCPLNLSLLIDRLLAKKPKNRHNNPAELIEDLNRVERGEVPLKLYKPKKSKKHSPVRNWLTVAAAVIIVAGCFLGWNSYRRSNAKTIIAEALSDASELAVEYKFKQAKNVLDDIISEYAESNPEQVKKAEALRTKLIAQHGRWIIREAVRGRQERGVKLTRAEAMRKRRLHNCLRNAIRLKNQENHVTRAVILIEKAYQLCNSDAERARVAIVDKKVQEALIKMRPWAAVADFTLDKSVVARLSGSAVAIKLEQALGNKYRLVTRNQVKKALQELRFQSSDLADKSKAKQFGKLIGAEYLISGSVIQLGREITVACQIFNIETGAIKQTAEVSAANVNDFNYMIRDAAKILGMSNAEKTKYIEKLNSSKRTSGGKYPQIPQNTTSNKKDKIIPGLGIKLVYVASGSFKMGSSDGEKDERPIHKVTISKAYWIGKYEVTQKQYQSVTGTNPSKFKNANKPVEQVNWNSAVKFCNKINEQEKKAGRLPDGYKYRLPTEAEWEFAARGGNKNKGYKYSGSNDINKVAWYGSTSGRQTHIAGTKLPNKLGIYDMSGNVLEWCQDRCDYKSGLITDTYIDNIVDPFSSTGSRHILRGGSFRNKPVYCRSANRSIDSRKHPYILGFRIVLAPCIVDKKIKAPAIPKKDSSKTIPGLGIKLIHVESGIFLMGANDEASSRPLRKVKIDKAYWIGKYELTQREYQSVMGINPSQFKGDNRPVDLVSWNDAVKFCRKLTEQEKKAGRLPSGYEYRLPTEAEWEYAACGGSKSKGYKFSGSNDAKTIIWNKHTARGKTHKVGTKAANELGIHDMSGNVYEWCLDNWHDNYNKAPLDATMWENENNVSRVYRGGGLYSPTEWCTVGHRNHNFPDRKFNRLGFRVALAPLVIIKPNIQNKTIPDLGMKLIYVAPGTFEMGSDKSRSYEKPVHEVTIHRAYWIGKYEVTQKEYQTIMKTNPSHFKGADKPVEKVSWHDALDFCKKLTERERKAGRLPSGYKYQLPTEAEWEYAARGGEKSQDYKYSGSNKLVEVAWFLSNSGKQSHNAGTKTANELGIHDMSGNVWEWCLDDWHSNYNNAPSDANRWGKGTSPLRVRRGGNWRKNSTSCRIMYRSYCPPTRTYNYTGFRVVLRSYFKSSKKPKKISPPKRTSVKTIVPQIKAPPVIIRKVYKEVSDEEHKENIKNEKRKARKRMYASIRKFSSKKNKKIEELYQSHGYKHGSAEKTRNLKILIAKYPKANRSGCAALYLACKQTGSAKRSSLLKVIRKYSDCYYGDGVNVGACAKYFLARYYFSRNKMGKLKSVLEDLRRNHRSAISHKQNNLASLVGEML